jgi:hypothetical protein
MQYNLSHWAAILLSLSYSLPLIFSHWHSRLNLDQWNLMAKGWIHSSVLPFLHWPFWSSCSFVLYLYGDICSTFILTKKRYVAIYCSDSWIEEISGAHDVFGAHLHKLIESVWRTCADFPLMKPLFLETPSKFMIAKIRGESSQNLVILGH